MNRAAVLLPASLFAASFAIFFWSPNHQMTDSGYGLLTTENLIRHGDLDLARYRLDHGPGSNYRLEHVGERTVYFFPVAGSLLSVPYLALDRLLARPIVDQDGAYAVKAEEAAEARLAGLLMAAFTVIVFLTARLVLPVGASLLVALVVAFGTQVYSTASRTLWSDSWALVLIGSAVHLLLRSAVRGGDRRLVWLATLESWAYFVRPTNSLALVGTGIFLLSVDRWGSWKFFVTVGLWLAAFVADSLRRFGTPLPAYFHGRLGPFSGEALAGTLISPSRGLLICVPATLAVILLMVRDLMLRHRAALRFVPLVRLAIGVCVLHWLVISAFDKWWGGHAFGARLCTGMVPWLSLLAILSVAGARREAQPAPRSAGTAVVAGLALLLCGLSVVINAAGAISARTVRWNVSPDNVDLAPERLWSWRRAQVLAAFAPDADAPRQ
jgi:hypothetical protein